MSLLLSILLLTVAGVAKAADCHKEFAMLQESAPTVLAFPLDEAGIQKNFAFSLESWEKSFQPKALKKKFIRLEKDAWAAQEYAESFHALAGRTRLLGMAHEAFSSSHTVPSDLKIFLNSLEDLNRAIDGHQKKEIAASALAAEKALAQLEEKTGFKKFAAAEPESVRARLVKKQLDLKKFLRTDLPTPKQLGEVSREVRELLLLSLNEQAINPSPASLGRYTYLHALDRDLSRIHEDFLQQARNHEIDYENQRLFLNPLVRERLEKIEGAIRNTLSSSGAPRK